MAARPRFEYVADVEHEQRAAHRPTHAVEDVHENEAFERTVAPDHAHAGEPVGVRGRHADFRQHPQQARERDEQRDHGDHRNDVQQRRHRVAAGASRLVKAVHREPRQCHRQRHHQQLTDDAQHFAPAGDERALAIVERQFRAPRGYGIVTIVHAMYSSEIQKNV